MKKDEYSQKILSNELALLWVNTIGMMLLAFYCVHEHFEAAFPWLTAMVGLPWAAWAASKTGYTVKSTKQNSFGGITYDMAMLEAKAAANPQTNTDLEQEMQEIVTDL